MRINLIGAFIRNAPFGTEIAFLKGLQRLKEHDIMVLDPDYHTAIDCNHEKYDFNKFINADATIVFKDAKEYNDMLNDISGIKIVYQPDDSRFPHIQYMMYQMKKYCDYVLTFDEDGAKFAESIGYKKANYLLVTADDELYRPLNLKKDIDMCFVGSLSSGANHTSRVKMIRALKSNGFNVHYEHDLYDIEKIVEIYNRSKIVLNHATDVGQDFGYGYGYQCRHFESGFTGACLLSNTVITSDHKLTSFETYSSEEELLEKADYLLNNDILRNAYSNSFYNELQKSHKPEHRAKEIISFIEDIVS